MPNTSPDPDQARRDLIALAELGRRMRLAQVAYFRAETRDDRNEKLPEAKRLEREFDQFVQEVLEGQDHLGF